MSGDLTIKEPEMWFTQIYQPSKLIPELLLFTYSKA